MEGSVVSKIFAVLLRTPSHSLIVAECACGNNGRWVQVASVHETALYLIHNLVPVN